MGKYAILAGLLVAGLMVVKLNDGRISVLDAVSYLEVEQNELSEPIKAKDLKVDGYLKPLGLKKNFYNNVYEGLKDISAYPDEVRAVSLSDKLLDAGKIAEFFERLSETQDVSTFVIIAENHSWQGKRPITISTYGYDTPFGKLDPDVDLVEELLEAGGDKLMATSYFAFKKEESLSIFAPFIKKSFPEAKIVTIAIKDFVEQKDLDVLVAQLAEIEDSVLIFSNNFSFGMDKRVADFQSELVENIFASFDQSGVENVNVDSKPGLYALLGYARQAGAEKIANYEHARVFYEGKKEFDERAITILAFGDMMMGRYVRTLMDENGGKDYVFEKIKGYDNGFFKGADVVFANLEGPIHGEGSKGGTAMVFSFNEDVAQFLKNYGFNLVSLANNHAVDQGWEGRDTTIAALDKAGLNWCGHPSDADDGSVYYGQLGDKKYAFICFQDVTFKLDDGAAINLIKKVKSEVDYLVVSIHWGYEYKHTADWGTQIEPGRAFIDAGADFVIGHHPHVVENFEVYNGKFIFYSLGNFVFDQYWSKDTQEELAIGIVLVPDESGKLKTKVHLFPMKSEASQSRLMSEEERAEWIERFIGYGEYSEDMKRMIRTGILEL